MILGRSKALKTIGWLVHGIRELGRDGIPQWAVMEGICSMGPTFPGVGAPR